MTLMERRRALMGAKKGGSRLPAEYQEVAWIQVSSSTHFKIPRPTLYTKYEFNCAYGYGGNLIIKDGTASGASPIWRISKSGPTGGYYGFRNIYNGSDVISIVNTGNPVFVVLDAPNNKFIVDGNEYSVDITNYTAPTNVMMLGGNGITGGNPTITFYSVKQYESNVLVHDLVPCYRKADDVIGLYDMVAESFLTPSGTNIVKGPDVT